MVTVAMAFYSLNRLDASANGIYGRHKNPRASDLGIFIYVLRILNPVDPLASASNLYILLPEVTSSVFLCVPLNTLSSP